MVDPTGNENQYEGIRQVLEEKIRKPWYDAEITIFYTWREKLICVVFIFKSKTSEKIPTQFKFSSNSIELLHGCKRKRNI